MTPKRREQVAKQSSETMLTEVQIQWMPVPLAGGHLVELRMFTAVHIVGLTSENMDKLARSIARGAAKVITEEILQHENRVLT